MENRSPGSGAEFESVSKPYLQSIASALLSTEPPEDLPKVDHLTPPPTFNFEDASEIAKMIKAAAGEITEKPYITIMQSDYTIRSLNPDIPLEDQMQRNYSTQFRILVNVPFEKMRSYKGGIASQVEGRIIEGKEVQVEDAGGQVVPLSVNNRYFGVVVANREQKIPQFSINFELLTGELDGDDIMDVFEEEFKKIS